MLVSGAGQNQGRIIYWGPCESVWSRPPGVRMVHIYGVAAGAGGGGGVTRLTGVGGGGGGAGSGGLKGNLMLIGPMIPGSLYFKIGAAGAGGAAGASGVIGGNISFRFRDQSISFNGTMQDFTGGNFGFAGVTVTGGAGGAAPTTAVRGLMEGMNFANVGSNSQCAGTNGGAAGAAGVARTASSSFNGGGSGGGGVSTLNVGSAGGTVTQPFNGEAVLAGGVAEGGAGQGGVLIRPGTTGAISPHASGGTGGAGSGAGTGGRGGDGGPGSGGGGGGAGITGGAGGNGGEGFLIIEWW